MMKMGEKIKELRKEKGISQEALAQVLGVSFQAVSKWETGVTMPDVSLIPPIASFFAVSIDELFDYNVWETERRIETICREAAALRGKEPAEAEYLLREGLKQYPANETMLTLLLYVMLEQPGREEDIISVCKNLLEFSSDPGVKYDVFRILAEAYCAIGKTDLAGSVLAQIPEFYFSKLECMAKLMPGETGFNAARFQMNLSGKSMIEMLRIMEQHYREEAVELAERCGRIAEGVLDVFRREGGMQFELPGYGWIG